MDLRSLSVCFLLGILGLNFPPNNVFSNIVFLCQVEELANLASSLGTEAFGVSHVGEAWEFTVTLLDDHKRENGEIRTDDAATDGFTFALAIASRTVARMALGKEKTNTCRMKNTLRKSAQHDV